MLLQIFAACPLPAPPACTMVLPIACRIESARSKARSLPPTMKVSVPAVGAADAARDRRVEHQQALRLRRRRDRARGLDIDGRAVDQQRAGIGVLDDAAGPEIDLAHLLPGRQHGDHDVGARRRDLRGLGDRAARGLELVGRRAG